MVTVSFLHKVVPSVYVAVTVGYDNSERRVIDAAKRELEKAGLNTNDWEDYYIEDN